jgi:hypothetical protein
MVNVATRVVVVFYLFICLLVCQFVGLFVYSENGTLFSRTQIIEIQSCVTASLII